MNFIKQLSQKNAKDYEYVEDQKDLRIPVQSEEAFAAGVQFKAKYIGTQEISRPSTRVEIVTAMRRIRYEFKYRNIKKRKVFVEVSVNGIRVSLRKKSKKTPLEIARDDCSLFIMHYPINRVFYVSHDSQDLKIFSFIARSDDGTFKCSVFKAIRKSTAMNIVRTIGQAFEVCHRLNSDKETGDSSGKKDLNENKKNVSPLVKKTYSDVEDEGETDVDDLGETDIDDIKSPLHAVPAPIGKSTVVTDIDSARDQPKEPVMPALPQLDLTSNGVVGNGSFASANLKQVQGLYHQQLLHQIHETEVMRSELTLVKEQLRAESSSRVDAQARVHRLLGQNRELIVTIQKLVSQLQEQHCKTKGEPIDESWILNAGLVSRAATTASDATARGDHSGAGNASLIDFESSVFDNVYQFANFDANKVPPPVVQSNGGASNATLESNANSRGVAPAASKTNALHETAPGSTNNATKAAFSPMKSIYSSESDEISESSWRDDSQDDDVMPHMYDMVATNNGPFTNSAVQNFAQSLLQTSLGDELGKKSTQID